MMIRWRNTFEYPPAVQKVSKLAARSIADLVFGAEALLGQRTGVGNYAWHIYQGMRDSEVIGNVHAFANLRWIDPSPSPSTDESPQPKPRRHPALRKVITALPGYVTLRSAMHRARFRRSWAALSGPLIYHEPNYVLRPFDGPSLTTIHDLGWIHYPERLAVQTRRWLEHGMSDTLDKATRIITVSRFVAAEINDLLGVAEERISVTPLGVDTRFHPRSPQTLAQRLAPLGLTPGHYLLSVSTLEPRKNLLGLIRAFSRLPAVDQRRYPLVLAGAAGWGNTATDPLIDRLERRGMLRRLGYVDDSLLPDLYAGAAALAAPAFYEGFGLPQLEAMASGVPVLTSNRAAMAEVAGTAALLVDPEDDDAMTDDLRRLLKDDALRARLAEAGLQRSRDFSWNRTVELTLDAYRDALGHNGDNT